VLSIGFATEDDAMGNLHIIIEGARAESAADKLNVFLTEAGENATMSRIQSSELPEEVRRVIDPLSLIGIILSIPGAVLAAMDLVDRIRKRKKAQALIDVAKQVSSDTGVQISIVMVEGATCRLDQLTADEVLDAAEKLNRAG
jgi:hypothetical protein